MEETTAEDISIPTTTVVNNHQVVSFPAEQHDSADENKDKIISITLEDLATVSSSSITAEEEIQKLTNELDVLRSEQDASRASDQEQYVVKIY